MMDPSLVTGAIVAAGVVVNWLQNRSANAKNDGERGQILTAHEARLDSHSDQIDDVKAAISNHGERLSSLESWRTYKQGH